MENLSLEKYGPRRQVSFRLGPLAQERLEQVAELFHMKPSEYAKALIYRELGVFMNHRTCGEEPKRKRQREIYPSLKESE